MQLTQLYNLLYDTYGDQGWWPGRSDWEILFGSVLIQNTNWRNVDQAIAALTQATDMIPHQMRTLSTDQLQDLIRPAGFFTRKAQTIQNLLIWLAAANDDLARLRRTPPQRLRTSLVALSGIGDETADDILLYVLSVPTVIIDKYTRRFFNRFEITLPASYLAAQKAVADQLPNFTLRGLQNFHALIVAVEKEKYTKSQWQDLPMSQYRLEWNQS